MSKLELFTIGHSNHSLEQFLALLQGQQIAALVDIRRFPSSRSCPQFNQAELSASLTSAGITYHWLESLGGRRSQEKGRVSANTGLENPSFRNYADYMQTEPFRQGMSELQAIVEQQRTAIMCAENVFWRCHRRLVSDYVVAGRGTVQHIFPTGELRPHTLTVGATVQAGQVTYPGQKLLFE